MTIKVTIRETTTGWTESSFGRTVATHATRAGAVKAVRAKLARHAREHWEPGLLTIRSASGDVETVSFPAK